MRVIGIKLTNGQEVICRTNATGDFKQLQETGLEIFDAREIGMQQTAQGIGLGMGPFLMCNLEAEFFISSRSITTVYEPAGELEKSYTKQVSKIALLG